MVQHENGALTRHSNEQLNIMFNIIHNNKGYLKLHVFTKILFKKRWETPYHR